MSDPGFPSEEVIQFCSNCKCQPAASGGKCGFEDWCQRCDLSLWSTRQYEDFCLHNRIPPPPVHPLGKNDSICPCGFFAIRNRPLAQSGTTENSLPMHLLVTIPITATAHITVCLVCEQLFKHHRNALAHLRRHHQHYHVHH
jgi:hypothetical protein